jgi:P-aminobenzoate N-oxygenase AurF
MDMKSYVTPLSDSTWSVLSEAAKTTFDYDYAAGREKLLNLYQKGKDLQWDSGRRIDWTREIDITNPLGVPDSFIPIYGSRTWDRLNDPEKANVRRHMAAWQFSQFLHGEQGALVCTAKIVQTVPMIDSKFYAATQVMDEARHVETYSRYLREKLDLAYPMNPHLAELLGQILRDPRWDMTYLGMQVMIEGVALGAFGTIRDNATEPTAREVNAYVMQDEARHVAFGLLALRDYYPSLTEKERDEREEFCVEAAYLLRDRFLGQEVWRTLDYDGEECCRYVEESELMRFYRRGLFMRIVPTLREVGLWGKRIQRAFEDMGVIEFASLNPEDGMRADEGEAVRLEQELRKVRAA